LNDDDLQRNSRSIGSSIVIASSIVRLGERIGTRSGGYIRLERDGPFHPPAILLAVVVANPQRRQVALLVVVVVVVSVIVVEVGRRRILVQWVLAVRRRDGLPGSRAHVLVAVGFVKQFERVRGVVREEEVEEVFECRW